MSDTAKRVLAVAGIALIGVAMAGIGLALFSGATFGAALGTSVGFFGGTIGASTLFAAGAGLIAASRKPPLPDIRESLGAEIQLSGDASAPRKIIYGEAWTTGVLRYRDAELAAMVSG
jgi:hypothetical protein